MTGDTRPDLPAAASEDRAMAQAVCEHFYASHCYRGMSIRLCMLCHEPDWDDLAGQLAVSPAPAPPVPSGTATGPAEGNWREHAERAEAQLAAVADFCKTSAGINYGLVKADAILAVIGTGREDSNG